MREEGRPTDAFAWTRPWVPYGDDPFVWYVPAVDLKSTPAAANDQREAPHAVAAEAAAPAPAVAAPRAESGDDMWVELPAVEDKPKRGRRGRGRGRGPDEGVAEAPIAEVAFIEEPAAREPERAPEPVIEVATPEPANDAPPVKKPRASRSRAKPAVLESVEETAAPVAVAAPEPEWQPEPAPAPRAPDPADISATPAPAPRKGWWRRG
jgi:ribonuclease E